MWGLYPLLLLLGAVLIFLGLGPKAALVVALAMIAAWVVWSMRRDARAQRENLRRDGRSRKHASALLFAGWSTRRILTYRIWSS
jgi:hypothetical protein